MPRPRWIPPLSGLSLSAWLKSPASAAADALQMWERPQCRDGRDTKVPPTFSPKEHDVRGRRRVDGKPERVSDREIVNQKRREEFHLPALFSLRVKLFPALLHSY